MSGCATIVAMSRRLNADDPRLTAHKMPMLMATEALEDLISSGDNLQKAIVGDAPLAEQLRIREVAMAQAEAYLDLMAQAATHVRALKP